MIYKSLIRPILFRLDPEWCHQAALSLVGLLGRDPPSRAMLSRSLTYHNPRLRVKVGDLVFPNPLGLAGGFDKNGVAVEGLAACGFGSVEVGSVSALPSDGNPVRPRLFRAQEDEAIVVFYGVPNDGAAAVAQRLSRTVLPVPLGINLVETNTGKPSDTDQVIEELISAAGPFLEIADYITLNLNCPNTSAGHSPFDEADSLNRLLSGYQKYPAMPPTFVKIVPSDDPERIDATLRVIDPFPFVKGISFGLPTGKPYSGLKTPAEQLENMPGTMCGQPVKALVDKAIEAWYRRLDKTRHVLVGIGGIATAEDAYRKVKLGASLLQAYTALIYHGPGLVQCINHGLSDLLERDGFRHISEAIGVDVRQ